MKSQLSTDPIKVNLKEVPQEGMSFSFDQHHPKMTEYLKDIIKDRTFSVEAKLDPMGGGVFSFKGHLKASLPLACYRCAMDFDYLVDEPINELLIYEAPLGRNDKYAKAQNKDLLSSNQPSVTNLTSDLFHIGELIHELIAVAEPFQPKADPNCDIDCKNYLEFLKSSPGFMNNGLNDSNDVDSKTNPFEILKEIKLKH